MAVTADRLVEIHKRLAVATPGPWQVYPAWAYPRIRSTSPACDGQLVIDWLQKGTQTHADAYFIAAAREDIPWLLDLIESVRTEAESILREAESESARIVARQILRVIGE